MSDQPTQVTLKLALERAALQESQTGVSGLSRQFAQLKTQIQDTGATADKSVRSLADAFGRGGALKSAIDSQTRAVSDLRTQIAGLGKEAGALGNFPLEGLRRTGGALSQLGLGGIGAPVSILGDIGQVGKEIGLVLKALGPLAPVLTAVAGAAAGLEIGMKMLDAQLTDSKKAVNEALAQLDAYYTALEKGTSQSLKAQIANLVERYNILAQKYNQEANAYNNAVAYTGDVVHDAAVTIGKARGDFDDLKNSILNTGKELTTIKGQIDGFTNALKSSKVAANDAAEALKAQQAKIMADLEISATAQRQELADSKLTSEQMRQRLKDLEDERAILQSEMQVLQPLIATNEEAKKKYEALTSQMILNTTEIDRLTNKLIPAKKATEDFASAIDKLKNFGNLVSSGIQNALNATKRMIEERDARVIAVQEKYENDVKAAEQKGLEERAAIQQRYNDRLVEIARNAADAARAELERLQQAREDLATSLGRDMEKSARALDDRLLTVQIQAQREDEKAARDHYNNLKRIRDDAAAQEVGFLLNRNFLGLYQSRLQTTRDITRANEDYTNQTAERHAAVRQQVEDEKRAYEQQRRERLIAYQQQLADAQLAYKRALADQQRKEAEELQLAREARARDIQQLSQKLSNEARIRAQAYQQDLRLAAQYGTALVKAHEQINNAILQRANAALSRMGQAPLFVASNSTTNNAMNVHMPITVNGAPTPQQTAQAIAPVVVDILNRIFH
jgi:hypothetical protein